MECWFLLSIALEKKDVCVQCLFVATIEEVHIEEIIQPDG
jgi:hypothetical protein